MLWFVGVGQRGYHTARKSYPRGYVPPWKHLDEKQISPRKMADHRLF